jgi:hypothetical protein
MFWTGIPACHLTGGYAFVVCGIGRNEHGI